MCIITTGVCAVLYINVDYVWWRSPTFT